MTQPDEKQYLFDKPENVSRLLRGFLVVIGSVSLALGVIGIFLPGLPTTVFLLGAAWGFSRSSARLQRWLWLHPRLGPPIRNWYAYRVIPPKAKVLAVAMMSASVVSSWSLRRNPRAKYSELTMSMASSGIAGVSRRRPLGRTWTLPGHSESRRLRPLSRISWARSPPVGSRTTRLASE